MQPVTHFEIDGPDPASLAKFYRDNSILPEYMAPLIITAAPYGPAWLPGDAADIAVTWDEQVQAAVDC